MAENLIRDLDDEKVENLVNRIKTLDTDFRNGMEDKKIFNDRKMIEYQEKFWSAHAECIEACNGEYLNKHLQMSSESKGCHKLTNKFKCMKKLYDESIFSDKFGYSPDQLHPSNMESRKLTIFLGIADLERFKCTEQTNVSGNHLDREEDSAEE